MIKSIFSSIFAILIASQLSAQSIEEVQINIVFEKLINAYGNPKTKPVLEIREINQKTPAYYIASPIPKIIIDKKLYILSRGFGKDSLNAVSIVLSHELAHYYSDHTFCTDFAFILKDDDKDLSDKLKTISKSQKIILETEADNKAIFYSAMAGYNPFMIYEELLDKIYNEYNLPDQINGYPTKEERKNIYKQTTLNAKKLHLKFLNGLDFLRNQKYDESIEAFEELNRFFPSRENYNNLGVAKAFKVLAHKPLSRNEYINPKRFSYPFSLDSISYLQKSSERSFLENKELEVILKAAQKDFEKAISLDPEYTKSYINLACVFDLLGNPEAAVGKLKELSNEQQNLPEVKKIMAIAYYHMGMETKAEELWEN